MRKTYVFYFHRGFHYEKILNFLQKWTDCIIDKILKIIQVVKCITTRLKSVLKLVKLQSWFANVLKCKKCKRAKFANFVYFCITRGKLIPLSRKWSTCEIRTIREVQLWFKVTLQKVLIEMPKNHQTCLKSASFWLLVLFWLWRELSLRAYL